MDMNAFMQALNQIKGQGGDPNQMIQQMLNSGRVTQSQYDAAMKRAQEIQKMFTPNTRGR